jgi:hypothetical protein
MDMPRDMQRAIREIDMYTAEELRYSKMGLNEFERDSKPRDPSATLGRPAISIEELRRAVNGTSLMAGVRVQGVRTNAPSSVRLAEPALLFQPYRVLSYFGG